MSVIITAEHFQLADNVRELVEEKLAKLNRVLPPDSKLRLFIKPSTKGRIEAVLSVHADHRDYVCSASGNKIVGVVAAAESELRRRIIAVRDKRVNSRRHRKAQPA
jgi:ribosome-associated translation inhibitor RaiA